MNWTEGARSRPAVPDETAFASPGIAGPWTETKAAHYSLEIWTYDIGVTGNGNGMGGGAD